MFSMVGFYHSMAWFENKYEAISRYSGEIPSGYEESWNVVIWATWMERNENKKLGESDFV